MTDVVKKDPDGSGGSEEAEEVIVDADADKTATPKTDGHKADPEHEELLEAEFGEIVPVGCGPLGKYPVLTVLTFALVGIGIGIGLIVDHLIYMILGAGGDEEYWAKGSLIGAGVMLVVVFIFRTHLHSFFLGG